MSSRKNLMQLLKGWVTIISFLCMIIFKSDIDFVNLANN